MTVTFNRPELIKVTEGVLTAHLKAVEDHRKAKDKAYADHAAANTEATRAKAKALKDALAAALRKTGPIYTEPLTKALGGKGYDRGTLSNHFYDKPHSIDVHSPEAYLTPAEVIEAQALIKVLKAAEGEVITANELRLLGLKNLGLVFQAAARQANDAAKS